MILENLILDYVRKLPCKSALFWHCGSRKKRFSNLSIINTTVKTVLPITAPSDPRGPWF
jgi:hypothetical protein